MTAARATTDDAGWWPRVWPKLLWLVLAGALGYVAVSLAGFDPADPPTHAVFPANETTQNWGGLVGAWAAYGQYRLLGWAAWLPIGFAALGLLVAGVGRMPSHVWVRGLGVLLIAGAGSALLEASLGSRGPLPGLPGGTAGELRIASLVPGLGRVGTVLVAGVAVLIGLLVAVDRWVWEGPLLVARFLTPAWHRSRAAAGAAVAGAVARSEAKRAAQDEPQPTPESAGGFGLRSLLARMRPKKTVLVRLNDVDDPIEVTEEELEALRAQQRATSTTKAKRKTKAAVVEEEAGEDLDEYEYEEDEYDNEGEAWEEEDADGDASEEDDEDEGVGAPQIFDRDALREKISKLPVRFGQADKQIATEEDLADMQNAASLEGYKFPGLDLLEEPDEGFDSELEGLVREQAESLESALREYRIKGEVVDIESGPAITLYHIRLAPGTKVSAIQAVSNDVARTLRAVNIRIVSNIEGRDTVGIEVPNPTKERVRLKELMGNRERFGKMKLPMFLGKDAAGEPLIADLTKMPHMLIAGTTGSGKSVCMNTIIMSFLYTKKPNELKLVLVDPKMVEMSQFKDIPHLMCPVVTEMAKAAAILEWAVTKMDERYELLADAGCRDIASYNSLEWDELVERLTPHGRELSEEQKARIPRQLPYMVFIIDELADLMMTNKEVEGSIIRIAQKARAVGIHLILATQRPQANVVTGLIKSNMPCRIAFKVASGMDSRIVLDQKGGELLLGQGDMLYLNPSSHKLTRAQGTLVDDSEIRKAARFLKEIAGPSFERQLIQIRTGDGDEERLAGSENNSSASLAAAQEDPLFDRAVEIVLETKRGSVSLLQRRLAIGYTRSSRLIDLMGIAGIISDHKGSVARDVMITPEEWEAMKDLAAEEAAAQEAAGQTGEDPAGQHHDVPDQTMLFKGDREPDPGADEAPPFGDEPHTDPEPEADRDDEVDDEDEEDWDESEEVEEDDEAEEDSEEEDDEGEEEWEEGDEDEDEEDEEGEEGEEDWDEEDAEEDDEEELEDEELEEEEAEEDEAPPAPKRSRRR